jgi:hypothetical protein
VRRGDLFLFATGVMALAASAPLAAAMSPAWLGMVAAGWVAGVLLIPQRVSDLLAEYDRSVLFVLGFGCLGGVASPECAFSLLFTALLLVRSPDFFGPIMAASLLVLGTGLARQPSYTLATATLFAAVCACHARAARRLMPRHFLLAVLLLIMSLAGGGLAALASTHGLVLPFVEWRPTASSGKPSIVPLICAILLLPVLAWFVVRYLGIRARTARTQRKVDRRVGRIVGDDRIADEARAFYAGPPTNEAVVRDYVRWRKRLAEYGVLFRLDRTAEESEVYLLGRLKVLSKASVKRITEIFNRARYGPGPVPEAEAKEFKALTKSTMP